MTETCSITLGEAGCAQLAGAMTFESVPGLYSKMPELFQGRSQLASLDLTRVTTADSAGLALLLEWQAAHPPAARALQIRNAPPSLMSLARLCEADELIDMTGRSNGS